MLLLEQNVNKVFKPQMSAHIVRKNLQKGLYFYRKS